MGWDCEEANLSSSHNDNSAGTGTLKSFTVLMTLEDKNINATSPPPSLSPYLNSLSTA